MSRNRFRPSPSMAVAIVALLLSVTGTAAAAAVVLIKSPNQLGTGVVTSRSIQNRGVGLSDISTSARNALHGANGKNGIDGKNGKNGKNGTDGKGGSALGYAFVDGASSKVFADQSWNVSNANEMQVGIGRYCFYNLPFKVRNAMVTLRHPVNLGNAYNASVFIGDDGNMGFCPGTEDASVSIYNNAATPTFANSQFYILFN